MKPKHQKDPDDSVSFKVKLRELKKTPKKTKQNTVVLNWMVAGPSLAILVP